MVPTFAFPNLVPRLTVLDENGGVLAQLSASAAGTGTVCLIAPHGIAIDSRGDIYVGEVS